jgi:hypothetical protein
VTFQKSIIIYFWLDLIILHAKNPVIFLFYAREFSEAKAGQTK